MGRRCYLRGCYYSYFTIYLRFVKKIEILECGDASPLSYIGTRPGDQNADASAHSKIRKKKKNKGNDPMSLNKGKSLESWIWDAACSIRGAKDAPKYKDYILPLIFAKRLCDVFDDEINRIAEEVDRGPRPSNWSGMTKSWSDFTCPWNRPTPMNRSGR